MTRYHMKFREFIEATSPVKLPFTGKAHASGPLSLPDLRQMHEPGEMPVGGYQSFGQMVQTNMDREQFYVLNTLETIGIMATNIYQAWQMRQSGQLDPGHKPLYPDAYFQNDILGGINRQELEGISGYKRLQPQQLVIAQQMGIVQADPRDPQHVAINIPALQQAMMSLKTKMRGYKYGMHFAALADEIMGLTTQSGRVPQSKSTNPMAS